MWIATRKFLPVAEEALGQRLLDSFLLHNVLHVKSPLPELTAASHVAIELPANVEKGFEQLALDFHERVRTQCSQTFMIVQPSLRRRSNRSTWISRWNQHRGTIPFLFRETCSCLAGDGVPGCHITVYVGTDSDIKLEPCGAAPTTDVTVQSANKSLVGLLQYIFGSLVTSNLDLKCRAGSTTSLNCGASRHHVCDGSGFPQGWVGPVSATHRLAEKPPLTRRES